MKKFLSLVLALVMTMSLVTVSAGAADFSDAEDITYVEAVEVMKAVGVVDGDTAGNFNPTNGLTRGAAAKIICNMILGPTTAAALNADTDPYPDVNKDSTFAGYIAYCQKEGIISGYADGTFKPAAPLTGYAFMKMLLGALGYDVEVEGYTGANWSINVAKRAINIGLDDGLVDSFNGSDYVTREEAMLYAFNAMQADMVQYDTTIKIGDITVAGSKSEVVANNGKTDGNIARDGEMQFAEKYFTKLVGKADVDAFDRPSTTWKNGVTKIGTYMVEPELEYTTSVKLGAIYTDLGLSKAVVSDERYTDGKDDTAVTVAKGDETKIGANGVLTQVWYDEEADYLIVTHINTCVGEVLSVTKATAAADRYVTIKGHTVPGTLNTKFETEEYAAEDMVAYTAAYNDTTKKYDIQTVWALEDPATGTLTAWTGTTHAGATGRSESNFTIDSDLYKYSNKVYVVDEDGAPSAVWNFAVDESELNVYVDEYGYALYVDGVEAEKDYAVVIGKGQSNQYGSNTYGVTLMLADGTQKTVTAKMADGENWNSLTAGNLVDEGKGDLVTYTVDDAGIYVLSLADKYDTTVGTHSFVNGKSAMVLNGTTYYTTSETVFVVATDDVKNDDIDYAVYTGYAEMPSFDSVKGIKGFAMELDSKYSTQVDVIYIYAERLAGIEAVDTYFVKPLKADIYTDSTGSYYVLNAIVEGEETTVKVSVQAPGVKNNQTTSGIYAINNVVKNSNGIITDYTRVESSVFDAANYAVGTVAANEVVLGIGGDKDTATFWAYNNDTSVYVVDDEYKTITVSSVAAVATDDNDMVYASMDDDSKVLVDVIIVEQDPDVVVETEEIVVDSSSAAVINDTVYVNGSLSQYEQAKAIEAALKAAELTDINITLGTPITVTAKDGSITVNYTVTEASTVVTSTVQAYRYKSTDTVQVDMNLGETLEAGELTVVAYVGDEAVAEVTNKKAVSGSKTCVITELNREGESSTWSDGHYGLAAGTAVKIDSIEIYVHGILAATDDSVSDIV